MLGRLWERFVTGLPVALLLLGALQLVANQFEPANHGMTEDPCPPPESHASYIARTVLLTIAGRPAETRDWADLCFYQRDNAALLQRAASPFQWWPRQRGVTWRCGSPREPFGAWI